MLNTKDLDTDPRFVDKDYVDDLLAKGGCVVTYVKDGYTRWTMMHGFKAKQIIRQATDYDEELSRSNVEKLLKLVEKIKEGN